MYYTAGIFEQSVFRKKNSCSVMMHAVDDTEALFSERPFKTSLLQSQNVSEYRLNDLFYLKQ